MTGERRAVKEKCVCKGDSLYPEALQRISHHPGKLYYRGCLPTENIPAVAIVGARKCSGYGKEMADIIYEEILGKYKHLGIIDTKAYDYERFLKETAVMAEELHLHQLPIEGDLSYLERLLTGFWDGGDFIRIAPHQTIMADMFPKGK